MNQYALIPTSAEPADSVLAQNRARDSAAFRSLAMQLRRNGHDYRRWSIEHAAAGHAEAAAIFAARADRYAADALWYWRRSRREPIQIGAVS